MVTRYTGSLTGVTYSPLKFSRDLLIQVTLDLGISTYTLLRIIGKDIHNGYPWFSERHYEKGNRPSSRYTMRILYLYQLQAAGMFDPIYFDNPHFDVQGFWDDVENNGIKRTLRAAEGVAVGA